MLKKVLIYQSDMVKFYKIFLLMILFALAVAPVNADKKNKEFIELEDSLCKPFIKNTNNAVVKIIISSNKETAVCSGVVIGGNQVITAKHCVDKNQISQIVVISDNERFIVSEYSMSKNSDLAILSFLESLPIQRVKIGLFFEDLESQPGYMVGFGCDGTRLKKNVQYQKSYVNPDVFHIKGCVCHGDSGGALFNTNDELIGIISNTYEDGQKGLAQNIYSF